jgi:hypothetical protein
MLLPVVLLAAHSPIAAQQPTFTPRDEAPEQFPDHPGREETFYTCTACHNFMLVAQQGMNRRQWDESIDLMIERHNMAPLEAKDRALILDYLAATFPPRARPGGWRNPFLDN